MNHFHAAKNIIYVLDLDKSILEVYGDKTKIKNGFFDERLIAKYPFKKATKKEMIKLEKSLSKDN